MSDPLPRDDWRQSEEKGGAHACPKCGGKMKVSGTQHKGTLTIRYIRCPSCGLNGSTCESIRDSVPSSIVCASEENLGERMERAQDIVNTEIIMSKKREQRTPVVFQTTEVQKDAIKRIAEHFGVSLSAASRALIDLGLARATEDKAPIFQHIDHILAVREYMGVTGIQELMDKIADLED